MTYRHQLLGAALLHPERRAGIPLMPEPIIKHDGTDTNDCERTAAKRFITQLRQDHPHLQGIVTEDSLSSNAPHIEVLHDHQCHYILGVKEGDQPCVCQQVAVAEQAGRVTSDERDAPAVGLRHRFRFVRDVPLNASHPDLRVNFLECWEWDGDRVQHLSWVTDLRVTNGTVYQLMRGGRARWRIEHETFNTWKNQGYHVEHNVGHGYHHLSVVFAVLMRFAFLVDQVQQLCCPLFQAVWAKLGSKRRLWERMRVVLRVCPDVDAAPVRSALVWLAEDCAHLGGFLLSTPDFPAGRGAIERTMPGLRGEVRLQHAKERPASKALSGSREKTCLEKPVRGGRWAVAMP